MLYLLDANVLILAQNTYYEFRRVNQYWDWMKFQAEEGRVKIPKQILHEVAEKKDFVADWTKEYRSVLILDEQVDFNLLDLVITEGYARDLTDEEIEHVGKDPFLIAYALKNAEKRIVVTAERHSTKLKRHKRRIPNVCDDLGIMNCDQWKLGRDLDFRTDWMDS